VYADDRYADWLLWRVPALRGRVAYDPRFELMSARQMRAIVDVKSLSGLDWRRALRGYRLLVVDKETMHAAVVALEREPGRRILYDRGGVVVLLRGATGGRTTARSSRST
jgi:hypothetical protein